MNILVVQETDWLRNLPLQSHHIMEALSQRGHQIRVVDFPSKSAPDQRSNSLRTKSLSSAHRTDHRSSVRLIRPGTIMMPGISRVSAFLTQFKVIFEQVIEWCDVIVLYSVPTNGVQALVSSRIASKPLVFHSFDVLHRMVENGILRFPTWALERFVCSRADKVIVISESLRSYMKKIGVPQQDIFLLPPAVNTGAFNPSVSGKRIRSELGFSSDDQVLLFSGWVYDFCGLDVIMASMNRLAAQFPKIRLIICGDGPMLSRLVAMREQLRLEDHVKILGRRPFSEMPQIVAAADICINPYLPGVGSNFAFPSKIAEYMAAAKAVVASDLPGTRSLLDERSGVILTQPARFALTIQELLLRGNFVELGKMGRKYCEENFSLKSITDRFEQILTDLLSDWSSHSTNGMRS